MALVDGTAAPLPTRDLAAYRSTHKLYEHRQYKRGLKVCEQLLRRHPGHAETMAMRALFLAHTGRGADAHAQARDALRAGVRSVVCWHVFGLIHRLERNYPEALKAYRTALRVEAPPGASALLRDAAALQTQLRLFPALVETRLSAVAARPALRMHWVALAVAYDLAGAPSSAADLVAVVRRDFPIEDYVPRDGFSSALVEEGELQLYLAECLLRAGRLDDALDALSAAAFGHGHEVDVRTSESFLARRARLPVDPFRVLLLRARALLRRGRDGDAQAARAIGLRLLESNSDSADALGVVLASVPGGDGRLLHSVVLDMHRAHPESLLLRSRVLRTCAAADLPRLLRPVVEPLAARGAGSAFAFLLAAEARDLAGGEADARRAAVESFCAEMAESPCAHTQLVLAQYWMSRGDFAAAVRHHERALGDASTRSDALASYAALVDAMAHGGHAVPRDAPFLALDLVRRAEPADRYANTMCVRYALRAGRVRQAKEVAALFLRTKAANAPGQAPARHDDGRTDTQDARTPSPSALADARTPSPGALADSRDSAASASSDSAPSAALEPAALGGTPAAAETPSGDADAQGASDAAGAAGETCNENEEEPARADAAGPSCLALDASPAVELQIQDFTEMQAAWFLLELGHAQFSFAVRPQGHAGSTPAGVEASHALQCASACASSESARAFDAPMARFCDMPPVADASALSAAMHAFATVLRHHADFYDDQFDFHNYALRRLTLSSYVSGLMQWEDSKVFTSKDYFAAAVGYLVCKRHTPEPSVPDVSTLKIGESAPHTRDACLDELLLADRLAHYFPESRVANLLALEVWMRHRRPVNARTVRSLCLAVGVCSQGAPEAPKCDVIHLSLDAEHIISSQSGAVLTPVVQAPPVCIDLSAIRRRVDLDNGDSAIRSSLGRALSALRCECPKMGSLQPAIATPVLDQVISAYSR